MLLCVFKKHDTFDVCLTTTTHLYKAAYVPLLRFSPLAYILFYMRIVMQFLLLLQLEGKGFRVYHRCFGRGDGILYLDLYTSPDSPCITCIDCRTTFSPSRFVAHSHRYSYYSKHEINSIFVNALLDFL